MRIVECIQGTDEWHEARRGIPTSSCFDKIVKMDGNPSKQAEKYLWTLAAERLSGRVEDGFTSAWMEEGVLREREARLVYAMENGVTVDEVGFCLADDLDVGCSPDGLVGEDGLVELKNPKGKTHVEYLVKGTLPSKYYQQVQGQLYVTGRDWCDFCSYYPGLPLFIIRVEPDPDFQDALDDHLRAFVNGLDELCEALQ